MIRLDKYLADMGCGTRQEVKKLIRSGQVSVDGAVVKKPETKVEQTVQEVCLNGEKVGYESFEYYMLNKPARSYFGNRGPKLPDCCGSYQREEEKRSVSGRETG